MIETKVTVEDAEFMIKHEECRDPSWYRDKKIFIESNSSENNTVTTVTFNDYLSIYIYWESHSSATSFEVLYVPETGVVFIGCGRAVGCGEERTASIEINAKHTKQLQANKTDDGIS